MINEDKIRQVYASDPKKGFKMLMDNFQVPIYNYIRRLVVSHEDAEDVLQEVFIRVYRNLDQFRVFSKRKLSLVAILYIQVLSELSPRNWSKLRYTRIKTS